MTDPFDDNDSSRRSGGDPFGRDGLFGPGGPFGKHGLFGPGAPFGEGWGGRHHGRGHGHGRGYGHEHGHGHGGRHGGGRRRKMFAPGELRLVLLALVAEEPRHGYDCIRAIEEATGGAYAPSPGIIYPTLAMLADEGLIAEQDSGQSRKMFAATDAGHAELATRAEEVAMLQARLGERGEGARAARSSDVMRALGNLASVLTNRAAAGRFSGENKEQIVDLIDELARRIERL